MAIKVIAQLRELKIGKNPGKKFVMRPDLYSAIAEKKVFQEAATHSGISSGLVNIQQRHLAKIAMISGLCSQAITTYLKSMVSTKKTASNMLPKLSITETVCYRSTLLLHIRKKPVLSRGSVRLKR